jgi:tetratricopeptide (TPR) repeat protein
VVPNKERSKLICLLLGLITVALFWPATGFDFINFDDPEYIVNNEAIHAGVTQAGVVWALKSGYASNWHPLTWVSHMVDCGLYGPKPGGHHLTNVLFHAANAVLLFLVLQQLTGARWRSALVAALFAWHPLHVESVAWVSERKDVLSTFFWLLTMGAYGWYGRKPGAGRYLLALGFFALGLLAKPMVVTLPFVLLLLDYWPLKRTTALAGENEGVAAKRASWGQLVLEKVPFLALAALDCVATFWAQKGANSVVSSAALPISARVSNALVSYVLYLWKMVWPADLAVLYPYGHERTAWAAVGACLFLLAVSAAVIGQRRERPYLVVGWFWFLGTLVPVIGLVQVGIQVMADRYTYVPLTGIFIMAAWGIPGLLERWPGMSSLAGVVATVTLLVFASSARVQLGYWQNSVTLFNHTAAITRDSVLAEYNLAEALARAGEQDQAIRHYLKALEIRPNRVEAGYNSQTEARYNLGALFASQKKWVEAAEQFRVIVREKPDHARAHAALGSILLAVGRLDEAVEQCQIVAQLEPGNPEAWRCLGQALARQGKGDEAVRSYREAVRLNPDGATVLNELAWCLATQPHAELRNGPEAVRLAQHLCELTQRREARFLGTLDVAYAEAGRFAEAIATAEESRKLALEQGQPNLATEAGKRMELYREGKCYRQP